MVSKDKAVVSINQGYEAEIVRIDDVFDSPESITLPSGDKIEKPYRIRILDSKGEIVSDISTKKNLSAKNWEKKFYTNKSGYIAYTKDETLLAVIKVLTAMKHPLIKKLNEEGEFNINDLKNVTFEAVLTGGSEAKFRWVNWVETFKHHNISVPEAKPIVSSDWDGVLSGEPKVEADTEADVLPF